jgi:hypothetical protein
MLTTLKATLRKCWGRSEASATNASGQTICRCSIDTVFVVSACVKDKKASEAEVQRGLEAIEAEIERHAWRAGVGTVLTLIPANVAPQPNEKWIRVVETPTQATQHIN